MRPARFAMHVALLALLAPLAGRPLAAQFQRPTTPITPEEEAAIEAARKGARPRQPTKARPLSPEERMRAKVFRETKPSVVHVSSYTSQVWLRDRVTGDTYALPPGTGTGFVWDNLGHVVTNHHVLEVTGANGAPFVEAEDLRVTLADGKRYRARVVGRSLAHDIAVLQVFAPRKDLKPIPVGTSRDLQVGQSVLALGNPWGLDHTLTQGIISALGREVVTDPDGGRRIRGAIQTDAAINPGNSGGPLLDGGGRLIGMNAAIQTSSHSSAGVGFAIPVDTLNRVVPLLIARGQLERPELGFYSLKTLEAANSFNVTRGVVVAEVSPGSLADKAGLRPMSPVPGGNVQDLRDMRLGDVIIGFQGHPIERDVELFDLLELEPPDAVLVFEVLRDGKKVKVVLDPALVKDKKKEEGKEGEEPDKGQDPKDEKKDPKDEKKDPKDERPMVLGPVA